MSADGEASSTSPSLNLSLVLFFCLLYLCCFLCLRDKMPLTLRSTCKQQMRAQRSKRRPTGIKVRERAAGREWKREKGSSYLIVSAVWRRYRQAIHLNGSDSSPRGVCVRTQTHTRWGTETQRCRLDETHRHTNCIHTNQSWFKAIKSTLGLRVLDLVC